jgi:hypothetical protein
MRVDRPDVLHSRQRVDFGPGFYVTPLLEQARTWCRRFKGIEGTAIVNRYVCDETGWTACRVLTFDSYSKDWLDFVLRCRQGNAETTYDIVEGGVANDRVFNTVELFIEGLVNEEEALGRLRFEQPNWQICFRTQQAIDRCLLFDGEEPA